MSAPSRDFAGVDLPALSSGWGARPFTQRFNVDDLESYMAATGDTAAIEYLAAKYLCSDQSRKVRALARVESLSAELAGLVASLKGAVQ